MDYAFLEEWSGFLPPDGGHVLAFSGSGGKTGLMGIVAAHYAALGMPVALTTTTRSEAIPGMPERLWSPGTALGDLPPAVFVHAGIGPQDKRSGLTADAVDALAAACPDRIVLCEVDGAAKMPLKLYREGEPVWPGAVSLALVVVGAGAVGRCADATIHRLGRKGVTPSSVAALAPHTVVEWSHLKELLTGDGGYLAGVPAGVPVALVLAGMDEVADSIGLFAFAGEVMQPPGPPLLVFAGRETDGPSLRTVYSLSAGETGGRDDA